MGVFFMAREKDYKWYDGEILRLTKRRKKGVLSLLFSRFLVFSLLVILQMVLFSGLVVWLGELKFAFQVINSMLAFIMLVYLFNSDMDPTGKLTWVFFMALFPIPISLFLLYTRTDIGHRLIKRRVTELTAQTQTTIPTEESVMKQLEQYRDGTDALVRWLDISGCFPAYGGSRTEYHASGEEHFASILEELRKAERYIFLESFIIEEGYMWGKILEILIAKAEAGVDVRVLYDGMCESSQLPMYYYKRLRLYGIKAKAFAPIRPIMSSHYNYRDHRKILVIDGRVAYTGGINMADEYIGKVIRFGVWKDAGLKVSGEAVKSYTLMFLQMWNIDERTLSWEPLLNPDGTVAETAEEAPEPATDGEKTPDENGYVIPYSDCPIDDYKVGKTVYLDIINRAERYVHIMTPYLILDNEIENALKFAAQRGVEVKLILPGIPDKKYVYALSKSYYTVLLDAGVKIYEYIPGFVHSKVFASDDCKAVVGSINLDYRSLYHHYECATYIYRATETIARIEEDFAKTLPECREVSHKTLRHMPVYYRVMGGLMRLVAPIL